ncbi:uncharacterized protein ATNIH1004_004461 [Aspergillus tanneri]|uniref:Uncharacterized protein n=1 Tax=Aspergillus tanneri TaxID=1220188 RepID=A0A5M9MRN5_9EURO|nr:uncharacterized protein ATNIH1004_004461 [Aspergillus tanneri]KAA8648576.1 hypothetical protein ATNIH1004_004461 [Aspergillus tanneri]
MSSTIVATIFTLPFLALISIPLIISACATICLAFVALLVRVSVVYIELCYAIISGYFTIPMSDNLSLLSFAASEPTTPAGLATPKRRSLDRGMTLLYPNPPIHRQVFPGQGRYDLFRRRQSSNSSEGLGERDSAFISPDGAPFLRETLPVAGPYPQSTFLSLISGDQGRDFEGVGGWRCPASSVRSHGHHISKSASPSPDDSVSDDADERAWLSINQRLELPSQSPTLAHSYDSPEHALLWRRKRRFSATPELHGKRNHQRSATTSAISSLNLRKPDCFASSSYNQDPRTVDPIRPKSLSSHSPRLRASRDVSPTTTGSPPQASACLSSSMDGSGGYFALRPRSAASSGTPSSGSLTPVEERTSQETRETSAHNPISARQRRSAPGPNSGSRLRRPSEMDYTTQGI